HARPLETACVPPLRDRLARRSRDRKSTRLNSSHGSISYAVFCLKKKKRHYDNAAKTGQHTPHREHTRALQAALTAEARTEAAEANDIRRAERLAHEPADRDIRTE